MNHASTRAAEQGDDFLRAAEAAEAVQDRHQLFVWMRLHLHRFVPHELAVCRLGACSVGEPAQTLVFQSVPLAADLIERLKNPRSEVWAALVTDWVFHGRRLLVLPLAQGAQGAPTAPAAPPIPSASPACAELRLLRDAGYSAALVQGLDSGVGVQPEVMFSFMLREAEVPAANRAVAALLLPHLYLMTLRALQGDAVRGGVPSHERAAARRAVLTQRELQILCAVREAKHNAEIGELLGITSATVKNHLRKIMRKLDASNRAQAVAEAMKRRLIF